MYNVIIKEIDYSARSRRNMYVITAIPITRYLEEPMETQREFLRKLKNDVNTWKRALEAREKA
jgi:hypothetical protein